MKSCLIALFLLCAISAQTAAQNRTISGKITYTITIQNAGAANKHDTTWLYFNDTLSSFVIDTKTIVDPKKINEQLKNLNASAEEIQRMTNQIVSEQRDNRIQYSYRRNGDNVYYRPWQTGTQKFCRVDSLVDFNWQLTADTMRILGFLCPKAVSKTIWEDGSLREFTAWYTPEIPLSFGPRNVFGLPGIVLKANSKYHSYTAVAIKLPLDKNETMPLSKCNGLPLIGASQSDKWAIKMREDLRNMQKLRETNQ